jgi:hypothetical protein
LLQAATDCLKVGGRLFVEDCDASGHVTDPPVAGLDQLHDIHIKVSRELGADIERGRMIGSYFHQLGLTEIICQSFVPIFGRGVKILPWGGNQYDTISQEEKFHLGIQLSDTSWRSLAPKFMEINRSTQEEVDKATESILGMAKADYQVFSIPGGKIFQWIGTKAET